MPDSPDSFRLKALHAKVTLSLGKEPVVLGRSRQLDISATNVSRQACKLTQTEGSVQLTAAKDVYLKRRSHDVVQAVPKGTSCQVHNGDIVYLLLDGLSTKPLYKYGFQLLASNLESPYEVQGLASPDAATPATKPFPSTGGHPGCFRGQHIVFWLSAHTATLRTKAVLAGASLEDSISAKTSLIVAAKDISGAEAAAHLVKLPAGIPLQTKMYQGNKLKLPTTIKFVVPQYISDCLAQDCLLSTAPYQITLQQVAAQDTRSYSEQSGAGSQGDSPQQSIAVQCRPLQPVIASGKDTSALQSCEQAQSIGEAPVPPSKKQKTSAAEEAAPAEGLVAEDRSTQISAKKIGIYPDVDPKLRSFTGGNTGIVWGTGNVWEEPWDQTSALDTIRKLDRHWHQLKGNASHRAASGDEQAAADAVDGGSDDVAAADKHGLQIVTGVNQVCNHAACSAQPICLIEHLEVVRNNYHGRADQFRIKAVERAISEINGLTWALKKDTDVERLTMGSKSKDKVLEILQTGTLRRNEALAVDERQQVIQLFMEVWGAAEATCGRWYADGCRTLDDLRARSDLTEQQVAGLKHFDDMQQRIPRSEVELVHGIVFQAVKELLKLEGEHDADRLHCRVTGSYIRGKPMTGDIDFLIMPPPSRSTLACGELLRALLKDLLEKGLLLDEMSPERPRPRESGSATWLGLCKPPGSPYVRRIDFKVYPVKYLAFAINYFIGSGPFVRALRYWANTATKELAQAQAPSATGFKLSDMILVPMIGQPKQRTAAGQVKAVDVLVPPGIECADETQIFRALGLAYVPPYMRFFGTNFQ